MHPGENYPIYEGQAVPAPQIRPKPVYTVTDTVYAWLSLVFAFLFCQTLPVAVYPLGGFLLILALFASGFVILRLKKRKLDWVCILSALSALVIGAALLLSETKILIKLSFAYSLASYCFFIYAAFGNRIEQGFSNYIYIDFIKVLIILPFYSIRDIFGALSNKSSEKGFRFLLRILIGIGMAIIPTVLVLVLLAYDKDFVKIMEDIFSFDGENVGRVIRSLLFTLPLAMYGFGLYASSERKVLHSAMTVRHCQNGLQKTKILPQLTAVVAVAPVLFLYVVFFISQWKFYVSGFTGVLPENFSYAQYARHGFFELCSVSVINLIMMIAIAFFIKRGKNGASVALKIVATVFCLCTLVLISTAVAKLVMYIDCYGLTQKRIYAMWLMALIGIVFLLIALGQYWRKIKVVAMCLTVAVVMFAGLSVCNTNVLCARYNADRYLSGSLANVDVEAMEELGDSAIPSLVRLATAEEVEKNPQLKQAIEAVLQKRIEQFREEKISVFSFSLPSVLAKSALKKYVSDETYLGKIVTP